MPALFLAQSILTPQDLISDPSAGVAILVGDDRRIVAIGPADELQTWQPNAKVYDYRPLLLVPGVINAHNHSFQSMMRGIADDRPFAEWRDAFYRVSVSFTPEDIYDGALLAFGEMLLRGITTVCDFFYLHHGGNDHDRAVLRAANDLGIRCTLARSMIDSTRPPEAYRETIEQAVANTRTLAKELQGNPLLRVLPAPHSPHNCSPEMVRAGAALAEELDTPWHTHVAEGYYEVELTQRLYGLPPLDWIASLGVLSSRTNIVHGVHLSPKEIDRLGAAGGGLLYCPSSNMFLGDGITALPRYVEAGARVALGSDGGSSNNRVSVFEEMRMAALLQKVAAHDGSVLSAEQVFVMGTRGGAAALGIDAGALEVGRLADFIALDPCDLSLQPPTNLRKHLVYAMESSAIRHVVVGAVEVVHDRQHTVGAAALQNLPDRLAAMVALRRANGVI
jgi:5-methylthioadenosine/S-adenosylhomocysteine deaminase